MSFNIPQTPVGGDYKGRKNLILNYQQQQKSQTLTNTPPDSSKKQVQIQENDLVSQDHSYFDDLVDVSDIDDINDVLKATQENKDNETEYLVKDNSFSRLDRAAKGVPTTEISTETDGWMDDVFNTNLYGMMNADDSAEIMPNHIFLDRGSPNNDLTPEVVISPLDFSTQINTTGTPLADKTNVAHILTQLQKKPFDASITSNSQLAPLMVKALCAFITYFFQQLDHKFSSEGQRTRIVPRNEYISEYLTKSQVESYSKSEITKILTFLKASGDANLAKLISYSDKLKEKKVGDMNLLKILANFSNPLLKDSPLSFLSRGTEDNKREYSVSTLNAVDQLSILQTDSNTCDIKFELNKFKILFNYHNGNSYRFTDFDRDIYKGNTRRIEVDNINEIKSHMKSDVSNCFEDIRKSQVSNNFLVCNASLLLNEATSSPSSSTKKKNFDLSSGNFISSVELLYHLPKKKDSDLAPSILNYQTSISIYNKNHLIHQKTEPIIGFKVNSPSSDYDTYNLKLPFQSNFWGGYLTWLLNGSDDDSVSDIIISQTIMDDDAHKHQSLVTLLWNFNDDPSNSNTVDYQVFEIVNDSTTSNLAGETSSSTKSETLAAHAPIMDSKLISTVITGNNSMSQLAVPVPSSSHKRTRSKSFSEFEHRISLEQHSQFPSFLEQEVGRNHQQQQQGHQFVGAGMNQSLLPTGPQYPHRLNIDFERGQSYLNHDPSSAPPSQQRFIFYPPQQSIPQQQHFSQSASNSPYIMQQHTFQPSVPLLRGNPSHQQQLLQQQQQEQQQYMQYPQRPNNFKSQSYNSIPNYNQAMMQQPPMRFVNIPGQLNNNQYMNTKGQPQAHQQQQQLSTPPSMTPYATSNSPYHSHAPSSRQSSLPTPTTPSLAHSFQQHTRGKQHIFAMANTTKASRQPSTSSNSSQSSSGTIPFVSSPSSNISTFKKMKGNFDQLLKIEFYHPPKN